MGYARRILHYSPGPTDLVGALSDRAVAGAWFELHRQGGCGAGELRLRDEFSERDAIGVGDWIAFEYQDGERWYLGRVEQRQASSPAGVTLRLEGMGVELGEVFPGGFGRDVADGVPPHRYAQTDLFPNDPDYSEETVDAASLPHEVVTLLMQQYVVPRTHITSDPVRIEESEGEPGVTSMKFRGEETVRSVLKELALRARNASWGVDEAGTFFFLQKRAEVAATFREGVDVLSLEESRERDLLFNRITLTGDYVYDEPVNSEVTARGFFRWRGHYVQPASREAYGERRIRLWVPWIRTSSDSQEFAREFFRVYAQPAAKYLVEVGPRGAILRPWEGSVRLLDRDGAELATAVVETVRVQFDHAPRFRLEIGPEDPRTHWPEPPHDERWEIRGRGQGDLITLGTSLSSSGSSGLSSDVSTEGSSVDSSPGSSSAPPSEGSSASGDSSTSDGSSLTGGSSGSDFGSSDGSSSMPVSSEFSSGTGGGSTDAVSSGLSGGGSSSSLTSDLTSFDTSGDTSSSDGSPTSFSEPPSSDESF